MSRQNISLGCLEDAEPLLRTRGGRPVAVRRLTPRVVLVRTLPEMALLIFHSSNTAGVKSHRLRQLQLSDWNGALREPRLGGFAIAQALQVSQPYILATLMPGAIRLENKMEVPGLWQALSEVTPFKAHYRLGYWEFENETVVPPPAYPKRFFPQPGLVLSIQPKETELRWHSPSGPILNAAYNAELRAVKAGLNYFEERLEQWCSRAAANWLASREPKLDVYHSDAPGRSYTKLVRLMNDKASYDRHAFIPSTNITSNAQDIIYERETAQQERIARLTKQWFLATLPSILDHLLQEQGILTGLTGLTRQSIFSRRSFQCKVPSGGVLRLPSGR